MPYLSDEEGRYGEPLLGYKKMNDGYVWIPPLFNKATVFHNGYAIVKPNNSSGYGIIDLEGKIIIEPIYSSLLFPSEGLIAAQKNGKWGYINLEGKTIVPFLFDDARSFSSGLAVVGVDYSNYIESIKDEDRWNTELFGLSIDEYFDYSSKNKLMLYGFVDQTGAVVIEPKYQRVTDFGGQHAFVSRGYNESYIINHLGRVVLNLYELYDFSGAYNIDCQVTREGTIWIEARYHSDPGDAVSNAVLDAYLRPIFPLDMFSIGRFRNGYAVVTSHKKPGVINEWGKFIIELDESERISFDDERFGDGIFNVSRTLPMTKEQEESLKRGYMVNLTVQNTWMDKSKRLIRPWGDNSVLRVFHNSRVAHEENGKWGFLDKNGNEVVPHIYDSCEDYHDGIAAVFLNNKKYLLDLFGNRKEVDQ